MKTIVSCLNDNEPRIYSTREAMTVARERNIVRYIKTEFCWVEVKRAELLAMLGNAALDGVLVCKEYKFAHYFFSKP